MGDPSYLRFVPADCASTPIHWDKLPAESRRYLELNWGDIDNRPLPATFSELAELFHETKFIGYMGIEVMTLLLDISEFGLRWSEEDAAAERAASFPYGRTESPVPLPPRFYMTWIYQVWILLFTPGKNGGVTAYSPVMPPDDEDEDEDGSKAAAREAEEREVARAYDAKLQPEIRLGMVPMVALRNELAGWKASTFGSNLAVAKVAEETLALPHDNPLNVLMRNNVSRMLNSLLG